MRKPHWVPFHMAEWMLECIGLNNSERGLYITACTLIYANGGPVAIDDLRGACCDHGNAFARQLRRLLNLGKLTPIDDGKLTSILCGNVLENVEKRRTKASENGTRGNEIKKLANATRSLKEQQIQPEPQQETQTGTILPFLVVNNESATHNVRAPAPEAEKPKLPKEAAPDGAGEVEFQEWYKAYPVHKGVEHARKAYAKAKKKATADVLLAGARRAAEERKTRIDNGTAPEKASKHPATWLNGGCWADDPDPKPRFRTLTNPDGNLYVDYGGHF